MAIYIQSEFNINPNIARKPATVMDSSWIHGSMVYAESADKLPTHKKLVRKGNLGSVPDPTNPNKPILYQAWEDESGKIIWKKLKTESSGGTGTGQQEIYYDSSSLEHLSQGDIEDMPENILVVDNDENTIQSTDILSSLLLSISKLEKEVQKIKNTFNDVAAVDISETNSNYGSHIAFQEQGEDYPRIEADWINDPSTKIGTAALYDSSEGENVNWVNPDSSLSWYETYKGDTSVQIFSSEVLNNFSSPYDVDEKEPSTNMFDDGAMEKFTLRHFAPKFAKTISIMNTYRTSLIPYELVLCLENNSLYYYNATRNKMVILAGGTSSDTGNDDSNETDKTTEQIMIEVLKALTDGSLNEIVLTDINMDASLGTSRKYSVGIADGQLKITEKLGKTINISTTDGKTSDDPIASQSFPLVINEIYTNNRAESLANPNHDTTLPVSHNFIEIASMDSENIINLDNVYLQYFDATAKTWSVLKLKGSIKPFSSYLIRGAQVAPQNAPTTIINVSTFDIEWYESNGKLKSFSNASGAFYLTTEPKPFNESAGATLVESTNNPANKLVINNTKGLIPDSYIDLVGWGTSEAKEGDNFTDNGNNKIIVRRNMFDKTTQANPKDISKRTNTSGSLKFLDVVYVDKDYLGNEASYRPMASFENKNLYTTRSDFRENRPYCVSVSFGINAETTRCFNWVSPGNQDEFLFYRKKGSNSSWIIKESYKKNDNQDSVLRYTSDNIYIPCYDRQFWETSGGRFMTTHKVIIKNNVTKDINGNNTTLENSIHYYTDNTLRTPSATPTKYTKGEEYEYIVGPAKYNRYKEITGPDLDRCSDILYFQVRSKITDQEWSFIQHSDEQGFHWMEYEVWRRVANIMRLQFNPQFTIDTGDMTQSGNRMNEWIDYNVGIEALSQGKTFSSKINGSLLSNESAGVEQMNVVGNNDLAPIQDYVMSTGNAAKANDKPGREGKCSPHQFNYFYCYEIDPENLPAIYNIDGTVKYIIPSCYSYNYNNCHFTGICSEITPAYAEAVYGDSSTNNQNTYDLIQEWLKKDLNKWYMFSEGNISKEDKSNLYPWAICYMHEMPFTVLVDEIASTTRADSIIRNNGCKLNDYGTKKFSIAEILQSNHVRLIMGGHKHTHSQSWPILENISYQDASVGITDKMMSWEISDASRNSVSKNRRTVDSLHPYIIIPKDASNDIKEALKTAYNSSETSPNASGIQVPKRIKANCVLAFDNKDITTAPVYIMSQASANKVISNSDVPTYSIPWLQYYYPTTDTVKGSYDAVLSSEKTNSEQRFPHFVEYVFTPDVSSAKMDAGEIKVNHWRVKKSNFCNFQTTKVFFNTDKENDGEQEETDIFATKSGMLDITSKEINSETGVVIKWTNDFGIDISVFG